MDAGAGFQQYQWNTGATSRLLSANSAGKYILTATTLQGCKTSDSLNILQVYINPIVSLGNDSILCTGKRRVLDAGAFVNYRWNTGNTNRQITITDIGFYAVLVTDVNRCKGDNSLHISKLVSTPANFLPPDTAICSHGKIILKANQTYSAYLWNNGNTVAAITIKQPGLYWLQAIDAYSCTGKDAVVVLQKDCMEGLYIPKAFSPNGDWKNDVFRPMIFGNVVQFE